VFIGVYLMKMNGRRPDQIARKFRLIEIVAAPSRLMSVADSNPLKTVLHEKIFGPSRE
jgi:hypothetical protein